MLPSVKNHQSHVEILKQKGLIIDNDETLIFYLSHIGYHRLSEYFKAFQYKDGAFFPHTNFKQILAVYTFDRKLRLLFLDAIERIEVSFRSMLSYTMCLRTNDINWLTNIENFYFRKNTEGTKEKIFEGIQQKLKQAILYSKEKSMRSFREKNPNTFPESGKIFNRLGFGETSFIFTRLQRRFRNQFHNIMTFRKNDLSPG